MIKKSFYIKTNPLNVFRYTFIASFGKHTNKQHMDEIMCYSKNKAVSISATVLYEDYVRKFWHSTVLNSVIGFTIGK